MSVTYTYESNTMYLHTLKVHSNIDETQVEHICVINEVFARCSLSLYSNGCLLITLMKALRCVCTNYTVHCTYDVTKVGHSCMIDEVFVRCSLSLYSTRCRLLTLMKAIRCICIH